MLIIDFLVPLRNYSLLIIIESHSVMILLSLQLYLLKKNLKVSSSDRTLSSVLLGDGLAHAFLNVMVCLLSTLLPLSRLMLDLDYHIHHFLLSIVTIDIL